MARTIVAVIVSYLLMFVLVSLGFFGMYGMLGAEYAFKPGTWEASNLWIALALVMGLVVAVIAGIVCALIAKGGKAPLALAIVVFTLGLVFAIPQFVANQVDQGPRTGAPPLFEAMQKAKQPAWVSLALPLIGVVGVLSGARLKRRS
jgi:hypothetical protein